MDDGRHVQPDHIEGYMERHTPVSFIIPPRRFKKLDDGVFIFSKALKQEIINYTIGNTLPFPVSVRKGSHPEQKGFNYFRITITESMIEIWGESDEDIFTAVQTIKVMLTLCETDSLLTMEVVDWSDIKKRGAVLDISRDRVISLDSLRSLIDSYALVRMNQLILYIEHTFAYEGHRIINEDSSPFTKEEILLIDEYCAQRGIELIINQNSFGHMERFLKHDRYRSLGENPDGFTDPWGHFRTVDTTVCPTDENVLDLFTDLYGQIAPLSRSRFFHVGGDEPWGFGEGRSREECEKRGIENVYADYMNSLNAIVSSLGKKMMIWADFVMRYPSIISKLRKGTVLMQWGYEESHPVDQECAILEASGFPFYVCCGTSAWNSLSGRWYNALAHITKGLASAKSSNAEGFMITEWGDNGHIQQFPIQLPPTVFGLCGAWNSDTIDNLSVPVTLSNLFSLVPSLVCEGRTYSYCAYALLAKSLCDLAKIGELYGSHIHNTTLLGAILTYHLYPYNREAVRKAKGYTFTKERFAIKEVANLLFSSLSHIDACMKDEILFTLELLQFLTRYGAALLDTPGIQITQIRKDERQKLAESLELLSLQYEYLWRRRSRPGGLKESVQIFESLIQELTDPSLIV